MTGQNPQNPAPTPASRREAHDSFGRRFRRTARAPFGTARRRRISMIAGGAAAVIVAGGTISLSTQPAIGEALGVPSASPAPALGGTALDRAQAAATLDSAQDVLDNANPAAKTDDLQASIVALSSYHSLGSAELHERIADTVDDAQQVSDDSADAVHAQAVAAQQKAAAAAAAKAAAAKTAAAAKAKADALAAANTPAAAKATASRLASSQYGWGADQFSCLSSLWTKESGWNYRAYNPSGATGIPQALPGSKMATIASDWQTNATTQVTWGLQYIKSAYGTPCAAWAHSQATNYY